MKKLANLKFGTYLNSDVDFAMANVYRHRYLPELYKRKGWFFGDYEYLGKIGEGDAVGDIIYVVDEKTEVSSSRLSCSYCKNEVKSFIRKYKSKEYTLKKKPPPGARDLNITKNFVLITVFIHAQCDRCRTQHGSIHNHGYEQEKEFTVFKIKQVIEKLQSIYNNYEIPSVILTKLRDVDNWTSELIEIKYGDLYD